MSTTPFPVLFLNIAKGDVGALEQAVATVKSTLAVNPVGPPPAPTSGPVDWPSQPEVAPESASD